MQIKISHVLLTWFVVCNMVKAQSVSLVSPVDRADGLLTGYTTSWLGNDGGYEESHIPHDMLGMYVSPDGTVATVYAWDEGGTNVAVFRNGRLLSRPEGSGTGGWGRFSHLGVVLDNRYVYHLLSQHGCDGGNDELNINGLPQFPPCSENVEWKTIRRYDLLTGQGAPFPGGYGYRGDMVVVATERFRTLNGLAIDGNYLYVAVGGGKNRQMPDSIKIYDKQTMRYHSGYPLEGEAGQIYADGKGGLWMFQGRKIVRMHANSGKRMPEYVDLPEDVDATTCCIDIHRNRLLIPNHGRDLNILIYDDIFRKPRLVSTFGVQGGIFTRRDGYVQGEVGPLRFTGPRAVGVDAQGAIYIANQAISGGRGAVLEVYEEADARKLWQQEGLIFTATADFDPDSTNLFFTPEKVHLINKRLIGKRVDRTFAYTSDPFTFPSDERAGKEGPFVTSCFRRNIEGRSFLIVSDMYGGWLAGFRFDYKKNGYIGIPSFSFCNGNDHNNDSIRCWMDDNGNGVREQEEVKAWKEVNPYSMSFFADKHGAVWRGVRGQGIMYWHVDEIDSCGNPRYSMPQVWPLPMRFRDAKRIWYDADRDELFLAGNSDVNPDTKDTWWSMCGTIVCCRNFLQKVREGKIKEGWQSDLSIYIPFHIEDGTDLNRTNAKAFAVAGDYIFVVLARNGWVTVYRRDNGAFVGRLEPGEEVHRQSGWADFNYAINARQMPDRSYEILVEENAFGKVLYYRWNGLK